MNKDNENRKSISADTSLTILTRYMLVIVLTCLIVDFICSTQYINNFLELMPMVLGLYIGEFIKKMKEEKEDGYE